MVESTKLEILTPRVVRRAVKLKKVSGIYNIFRVRVTLDINVQKKKKKVESIFLAAYFKPLSLTNRNLRLCTI